MNVSAACFEVAMGLAAYYDKQSKVIPCHSNRASAIGFPCLRNLVYCRTHWQEKRKPSPELMAIFKQGTENERVVIRTLNDAGYRVITEQRAFEDKNYQLTGHIEGSIKIGDGYYLFEIKSLHPYGFDSINCWEDFLKSPIYGKYPAQGQIYMFLMEVPEMIFIIANKSNGQIKLFPMWLDLDYAETLIKKCEAINKHVAEGTLPDRMEYDQKICSRLCDFSHICLPAIKGEGLQLVDDERLEALLETRAGLYDSHLKYNKADKQVKHLIKNKRGLVIGRFVIEGKMVQRKGVDGYWKSEIKEIEPDTTKQKGELPME